MKISTKGRYGLMAMFQLALEYGDGPIPLKSVALKQNISDSYLEQLFSTLRKDKLLKSVRGAQGGYMLSRPPHEITVGHILRSLEGDLAPADCAKDDKGECLNEDNCASKLVFVKIKDSIDEVIDAITLKDMIEDMKDIKAKH
jgi:Rrf2 family transcriptional regulator, cysteine metabolism repressor